MPIEMEIIRLLFLNEVNSQMAHRPESMDWDMVTLVLENMSLMNGQQFQHFQIHLKSTVLLFKK